MRDRSNVFVTADQILLPLLCCIVLKIETRLCSQLSIVLVKVFCRQRALRDFVPDAAEKCSPDVALSFATIGRTPRAKIVTLGLIPLALGTSLGRIASQESAKKYGWALITSTGLT